MRFRIPNFSFSDWLTSTWLYRKLDWTDDGRYWFAWRPVFLEDDRRYAWLERVQIYDKWNTWEPTNFFDWGFDVTRYYYSKEWHG